MRRWCGILAGLATHGVFFLTVWRLFLFLQDTHYRTAPGSMVINALLAIQFSVPHSLLLHPSVRKQLGRLIPPAFYGCFYSLVTCCSLWLMFLFWRQSPLVFWRLEGMPAVLVKTGFFGSWIALFYSLSLTGFGWQTGWTPWIHWVRGLPQPKRPFEPRGAYRFLRHPVYLSFLGLIWFTPTMTFDHALLTVVWTAYILLGSYLKDERLAYYLGESYRRYQAQVAGYPAVPFGALGKRPLENHERVVAEQQPLSPQFVRIRQSSDSCKEKTVTVGARHRFEPSSANR
jgi:protein-S-isoprenylcysteine O-methyltransferase Ste14